MKISLKITKFLDNSKIKYEVVSHKTVYTSFDKAATLKVKPSAIGKTLILKADSDLILALISGNKNLDRNKLKNLISAKRKKQGLKVVKKVDFVSETVLKSKFKGIRLGAIPPFGFLYKTPMFIEKALLKEKNIFINTGIYEASFSVSPRIFTKLGHCETGIFSKAKK